MIELPKRKIIRKPSYDYRNSWSYFITICTKNHEHFFWKIQDNEIILNNLGTYIRDCRKDIPNHFSFVEIGEFICMPNHIHGILTINNQTNRRDGLSSVRQKHPNDDMILDRTKNISSLHGAVSWSLWSIIRGFKIGVTKFANQNFIPFKRQSRYYDHIILDEKELFFIEEYIRNNPKNRDNKNHEW